MLRGTCKYNRLSFPTKKEVAVEPQTEKPITLELHPDNTGGKIVKTIKPSRPEKNTDPIERLRKIANKSKKIKIIENKGTCTVITDDDRLYQKLSSMDISKLQALLTSMGG